MNKLYIGDIPLEGGFVCLDDVPMFSEEEMIQENLVGGFGEEVSFEVKINKKALKKLVRNLKRELMGRNNWRKLHGLPMHRKG